MALPPELRLQQDDPLHPAKQRMLQRSGLGDQSPADWRSLPVSQCLAAARVLCLREGEAYDVQQQGTSSSGQAAINPRNEAAALSLLWAHCDVLCGKDAARRGELTELSNSYSRRTGQPAASTSSSDNMLDCEGFAAEAALFRWASAAGMRTSLQPATCSDGLRGLCATQPLHAGEAALSLPTSLLITYDTARTSDLGRALAAIPNMEGETLALVWTMVDRHEEESPHAPFWQALPLAFGTALSASDTAIDLLRGTPVYASARSARRHVRAAFEALASVFQTLLRAYPQYMQQHWFTEEAYLWAVELWYAYAIEVSFPDGQVRSCLAPVVSLLNHSPWPHIVRFSNVDAATDRMELPMLRSCSACEQVMLSYGPKANENLLLFYGFAVPDNPFDRVEVTLPLPKGADAAETISALERHGLGLQHWLTHQQPLPAQLLAAARLLVAAAAPAGKIEPLAATSPAGASKSGQRTEGEDGAKRAQTVDPFSPATVEVEAAALRLLRPTLMQAKLWRAALERVSKALAQCSSGPSDPMVAELAPVAAQGSDGVGGPLAADSGFLGHAAVMLRSMTSILEAAAEKAAELEQIAANQPP